MTKMIISCGSREVSIYIPKEASGHMPVVYSCMFGDEADETAAWLYQKGGSPVNAVFAAISGGDWDNDLSPWPAPKAFKGGSDFGGGADDFIKELAGGIMSELIQHEYDHLDGILATMRAIDDKSFIMKE